MRHKPAKLLLLVVIAALAYGLKHLYDSGSRPATIDAPAATSGAESIAVAFDQQRSGFMVESAGIVERVLPDDREGSPHQRFIVRLANDHTVLISHNIDLARRVPLHERDAVRFRGQYGHPRPNSHTRGGPEGRRSNGTPGVRARAAGRRVATLGTTGASHEQTTSPAGRGRSCLHAVPFRSPLPNPPPPCGGGSSATRPITLPVRNWS